MNHQSLGALLATCEEGADLLPRLVAQLVQQSNAHPFEDDLTAITLRRRTDRDRPLHAERLRLAGLPRSFFVRLFADNR